MSEMELSEAGQIQICEGIVQLTEVLIWRYVSTSAEIISDKRVIILMARINLTNRCCFLFSNDHAWLLDGLCGAAISVQPGSNLRSWRTR